MALELDPKYNPRGVETKWYEAYESHNAFQPEFGESAGVTDHNAKPFSIVIPPPNVTGSLHVGHALDQTIQDVLIRTARKLGRPTLWLPGMDHAGIATQSRVEKTLQEEEGLSRHDLGRGQGAAHARLGAAPQPSATQGAPAFRAALRPEAGSAPWSVKQASRQSRAASPRNSTWLSPTMRRSSSS